MKIIWRMDYSGSVRGRHCTLHTAPTVAVTRELANRPLAYFTCSAMGRGIIVLVETKFILEKNGNRRNAKAPMNMVAAMCVQPFLSNSGCDSVPPMKAIDGVETFAEIRFRHGGLHDIGEITLNRICLGI
jgi:hypothetical protein